MFTHYTTQRQPLFSHRSLADRLAKFAQSATKKIDEIPQDQFLAIPLEDIVQHIVDKLTVNPLVIDEDGKTMKQKEVKVPMIHPMLQKQISERVEGPGIQVKISIPYTGNHELWHLQPNSWTSTVPYADVHPPNKDGLGYLDITIEQSIDSPKERIKSELDNELRLIRFYLNAQSSQIHSYNQSLEPKVKKLAEARRNHLHKYEGLAEFLEIPLKKNTNAPEFVPINIQKKLVKPLPPPPNSGYKPEPGINEETYEHILSVIRHEGKTFETTPKTYAVHDEEELRDIIRSHLNGHYLGAANGEAFRKSGKSDIKIEDNNMAAFIAECKVWRGDQELRDAVDQLLSYLTWRDCKASIIIFNKDRKQFTKILAKIPDILKAHSRFKRFIKTVDEGEWHFEFMSQHDDSRLIQIRVFIFDIYIEDKES